jgi:hypothetical protein
MMNDQSDASGKEPEVRYLVEDLCEAYQHGLVVWDARVGALLVGDGDEVQAAKELRETLEEGPTVLGKAYTQYYRQAGRHFAVGDDEIQTKLAHLLHILTVGVVEVLQLAHDDAISGIPCMPSSFDQYQPINYPLLRQRSGNVRISSTRLPLGPFRCIPFHPSLARRRPRVLPRSSRMRVSLRDCGRRFIASGMCIRSCLVSTRFGSLELMPRGRMSCVILRLFTSRIRRPFKR